MNPETKEEITPTAPDAVNPPEEAVDSDPGEIAAAKAAQKEEEAEALGAVNVGALSTGDSTSEETQTETHYIAIELKYEDNGDPVIGEPVKIKLPNGSIRPDKTDDEGKVRIEGITQSGQCEVNFPRICKKEWKKA